MGPRLEEKRILWVDPNDHHSARGADYLHRAARGLCLIEAREVTRTRAERLETESYELCHLTLGSSAPWPGGCDSPPRGHAPERLASSVVISSGDFAERNWSLRLAVGAPSTGRTFFEVIARRFGLPPGLR